MRTWTRRRHRRNRSYYLHLCVRGHSLWASHVAGWSEQQMHILISGARSVRFGVQVAAPAQVQMFACAMIIDQFTLLSLSHHCISSVWLARNGQIVAHLSLCVANALNDLMLSRAHLFIHSDWQAVTFHCHRSISSRVCRRCDSLNAVCLFILVDA